MKTRHFFSKPPRRPGIDPGLMAEIRQTMFAIDSARNHFEQVVDPTLIDCYIYELNAAQLRYQFLLKRVKSMEVWAQEGIGG